MRVIIWFRDESFACFAEIGWARREAAAGRLVKVSDRIFRHA